MFWLNNPLQGPHCSNPRRGGGQKRCPKRSGCLELVCLGSCPQRIHLYNNRKEKHNTMKLRDWNVRILLNMTETYRPERRTAFVARELKQFNFNIVALTETRWSGEGQLKEEQRKYTFYWKGKAQISPGYMVLDLPSEIILLAGRQNNQQESTRD